MKPKVKKFFFVEDNPVWLKLITIRLENLGYIVCGTADNARDAITRIKEQKPDVVLLDIELHGAFEGINVGDFLVANTDIPFVYMSNHDEDLILLQARNTIPDGFLVKNCDDNQLRVAIEMASRK